MNYRTQDLCPALASRLKALSTVDAAAQRFFGWAAQRQYDATQTSIDYLAQKASTDRRQAIALAKHLEELGLGRFVVGRRGAKSRMVWSASLKSIGHAAVRGL